MTEASGSGARLADRPGSGTRARVLGGFEVAVGGRLVTRADWHHASAERLMKLLLVTPGHQLTREAAAETLWPGGLPDRTRANLRKAIHFARRALGPDGPLVADRLSVALDGRLTDLDLDRFETAVEVVTGRSTTPSGGPGPGIGPAVADVLRLGALEVLPNDPYEDWLAAPRERIRARWTHVALEAARMAHRLGRREEAHDLVDRLLARDPADEAAHRLAIELYAVEGRPRAMRQQVDRCRAALREIDAEPTPETRGLIERAGAAGGPGTGAGTEAAGGPGTADRAGSGGGSCRPRDALRGPDHAAGATPQERSRNGAMRP